MGKIIFTFFLVHLLYAQQDTLLYKNYLDYYSNHAKSTVLTKDLQFLPNGNYIFKGDLDDFYYLLSSYIRKDVIINKGDTLYLSGTIKDSVKIGRWIFSDKKNEELDGLQTKDFGKNGGIEYVGLDAEYKKKKIGIWYRSKMMFVFNILKEANGKELLWGEERFIINRYNDSIKYKRELEIDCGENESAWVVQESNDLNRYLETAMGYDKRFKEKLVTDIDVIINKTPKPIDYVLYIKEKFKNQKLVEISIEESKLTDDYGREMIGEQFNNTNFYHFYTGKSKCLKIPDPNS